MISLLNHCLGEKRSDIIQPIFLQFRGREANCGMCTISMLLKIRLLQKMHAYLSGLVRCSVAALQLWARELRGVKLPLNLYLYIYISIDIDLTLLFSTAIMVTRNCNAATLFFLMWLTVVFLNGLTLYWNR